MPTVQLSIGGVLSSVAVESLDVPLSAVKALAPAAAACALLIGGLPYPDDATLAAAKYDGASPIYAVRAGVTLAEAAQHRSKDSLWMLMNANLVTNQPAPAGSQSAYVLYDLTSYLDDHPGGAHSMLSAAAKGDATKDFLDVGHSASARKILLKRPLGVLCAEDAAGLKAAEAEKGCAVA